MKRIYVPTASPQDWQRLLAKPGLHWKAGYSAMSLARCWEDAGDCLPAEIAALCIATRDPLFEVCRLLLALPEYRVDLEGGSRPTQTDLFALVRGTVGLTAIAIEGKVDESFGPTVDERSRKGAAERLDYLHRFLRLDRAKTGKLRYQLLHRSAAALLLAREFNADAAAMIVHSFSAAYSSWDDFTTFCEALGTPADRGRLVRVGEYNGLPLFVGWAVGDQKFREPVPAT